MLSEIVYVSPLPSVRLVGFVFTLDGADLTVTLQLAVFPFEVLTVMIAVPVFLAVTFPLLTVATLVLELFHVTVCTAFEGDISDFKVYDSPTPKPRNDGLTVIAAGITGGFLTVSVSVAW